MLENIKVDLHIHSFESDGTWDMDQLLNKINKKNIDIFSVTDHDSFKMVKDLINRDLNNKIFIPGIELSSTYNLKEFHITSYCYDIDNKELLNLINYNNKIRKDFNKNIIYYFENIYNKKLINKYYDYQNDNRRGGWKAFNFLLDYKLIDGLPDLFKKISNMEEQMIFLSPKQVIDKVHQAGGYTFLAHPGAYYNKELLDKDYLLEWIKMGIDGIEAYSPYLKKANDAKYYIEFCNNNGLMISGGSDSHGDFIKERKIGIPQIFLEDLNIDKLLTNRKEGVFNEINR